MQRFPFGLAGFLIAVAAAGVLGDLTLRDIGPDGINLTIWGVYVLGVIVSQVPRFGILRDWSGRIPLAVAFMFVLLYSWRDAEPLKFLIFLIVSGSIMLTAAATLGRSLRVAYVLDYIADGANFVLCSIALPFAFFARTQTAAHQKETKSSPVFLAVARGVLISVPLLLVFGALLVSADAMFESYVVRFFNVEELIPHVLASAVFGWAAAVVWVFCLIAVEKPPVPRSDPNRVFPWGVIEINVALGILSVLFLAFIGVQVRYFFGGHEHVLKEAGLTYADYARQGFFELAWVAAIALALLSNCARTMHGAGPMGKRIHKIVTLVIVAAIMVIIASAFHRMRIYVDAYGYTRLRVYTSCFMIWMVAVFVWLYYTIARERIRSFVWGTLLSGYAATVLLLMLNPDAFVAKQNLQRAAAGKPLDMDYMKILGADAVVPTVRAYPALPEAAQLQVKPWLIDMDAKLKERPQLTWTVGLQQARTALKHFEPASR